MLGEEKGEESHTHTIRGKRPSQSHSKKTDKRVRKKLKRKKEENGEKRRLWWSATKLPSLPLTQLFLPSFLRPPH